MGRLPVWTMIMHGESSRNESVGFFRFSTLSSPAGCEIQWKNLGLGCRNTVRDCILDAFAGPPDTGIFSPSVQNTLYLAQKKVLETIPQMSKIEVRLPNKHYFPVDFSKLNKVTTTEHNDEVFLPVDKPAGNITAILGRKSLLQAKL